MGGEPPEAPPDTSQTVSAAATTDQTEEEHGLPIVAQGLDDVPRQSGRRRNRMLAIIVAFLILYVCSIAEIVLVPMVVAILFGLMLSPVIHVLERWHVPRIIGTFFVITVLISVISLAFAGLATPARSWLQHAPRALDRIEHSLKDLQRPFSVASEASKKIEKMTGADESGKSVRVVSASPGIFGSVLNAAPALIASFVETLFLTFLFVLHGDTLLRKFVTLAPHLRAKRDIVIATRQAQRDLSSYVITITIINAVLGLATALALWWLGVKDPLLWGTVAALFNYAPYVGPLFTAAILTVVGFGQFADPLAALAVPGVSLGLHVLEGELITPHLVGRRLKLDPVMVFIALILLAWLWGVAGLLLAVPLMTCAKLIAERTPQGAAFARLLSK
ncbi:MAG: AI-2E family transporter [Rhodanobacteraceae bacterium]